MKNILQNNLRVSECFTDWMKIFTIYIYILDFILQNTQMYSIKIELCFVILIASNVISDKEGNSLLRDFENQGICTHKNTRNI